MGVQGLLRRTQVASAAAYQRQPCSTELATGTALSRQGATHQTSHTGLPIQTSHTGTSWASSCWPSVHRCWASAVCTFALGCTACQCLRSVLHLSRQYHVCGIWQGAAAKSTAGRQARPLPAAGKRLPGCLCLLLTGTAHSCCPAGAAASLIECLSCSANAATRTIFSLAVFRHRYLPGLAQNPTWTSHLSYGAPPHANAIACAAVRRLCAVRRCAGGGRAAGSQPDVNGSAVAGAARAAPVAAAAARGAPESPWLIPVCG